MKKSVYKTAMSNVQTSEDFKEATYEKLMREMERTTPFEKNSQKGERQMENAKKRRAAGWTMGIAACAVATVGILTMSPTAPTTAPQPTQAATKPPAMGKAAVNIDGVISEVSPDGKSFKIGNLWVTISDRTRLGIDGPTAAKPSEELLQKEFKVGNAVSGYTSQDLSAGKVTADVIYNNIAPQH
ncbi:MULTISPECIES: hypothetical protein [unclassified Paenibacillus]|uniref:hypothetical protein n=1 Tax=unclassified Paenibacillus TaxID=185978 RepID=UPI0009572299|nr:MULTISPECIES: hypothetical protein [unclassified Paenibacillus]ASS67554.2 hypothetical protein CIC07_16420 [Paenibacillus sp. RUD330]SIQ72972.1 hypothetical protein SAMN05880555_2144 [Paenibacillus sp. RU4X]SIQ94408.1 hypothetical protein SAMN05880570_2143 [Paenibacillus sp. RU4T]